MVYKFFGKKTAGGAVKNGTMLTGELHKPIIRKLLPLIDNIEMLILRIYNY